MGGGGGKQVNYTVTQTKSSDPPPPPQVINTIMTGPKIDWRVFGQSNEISPVHENKIVFFLLVQFQFEGLGSFP